MTTLYTLNVDLYNNGGHVIDTQIVSGHCPDDTLRITLDNGEIVYASFDIEYTETILFSSYAADADGEEEIISEGGWYDCVNDPDKDADGLYRAILDFCSID